MSKHIIYIIGRKEYDKLYIPVIIPHLLDALHGYLLQ